MADAAKPFKPRAPVRPKKRKAKVDKPEKHELSLPEQLDDNRDIPLKNRTGKARKLPEVEEYVNVGITNKILREARKQQQEVENERDEETGVAAVRRRLSVLGEVTACDSDDDSDEEPEPFSETQSQYDEIEDVSEEQQRGFDMFMSKNGALPRTLSDMVMERLRDKNAGLVDEASGERAIPGVDDSILEVYRCVGKVLSRFTTGKVPKAFKVLPSLKNWQELLYVTEPEKWSPHAMYQATRIFASNLNPKMAQVFYDLVLLPRLRADIRTHKRLHFALYQAVKKSVYKPAAFFQGIIFSLCHSGTCTLREAVIIGSVMQKMTIPSLHSSVALLKIAEMDYNGTNSYFMKLLIDKKYSLPYQVLDSLVAHFARFSEDERDLPVIWHLCLLSFVQRYKHELRESDKCELRRLLQRQRHYKVTPEIERELQSSRIRGQKQVDTAISQAPVATIMAKSDEDIWSLPEVPIAMQEE